MTATTPKITHAKFEFENKVLYKCQMVTDTNQVLWIDNDDIGFFMEVVPTPELIEEIKAGNKPNAVPELQKLFDQYGIASSDITDACDGGGMRPDLLEKADDDEELEEKQYKKIHSEFLKKSLAA